MRIFSMLILAILFPSFVLADALASQPTTPPAADDTTPLGFLHSSSQLLPAGGFAAA